MVDNISHLESITAMNIYDNGEYKICKLTQCMLLGAQCHKILPFLGRITKTSFNTGISIGYISLSNSS